MKKPIYILAAVAVLLSVGALPVAGFYRINVFSSPAYIAAVLIMGLAPLFYQFKKRSFVRQLAYILTHYGILLILIGGLLELTPLKREGNIVLKEGGKPISFYQKDDGSYFSLPFSLTLTKALTEYYEPESYELYQYDSYYDEVRFSRRVTPQERDSLSAGFIESGENYDRFEDGSYLRIPENETRVKTYLATILVNDSRDRQDVRQLKVNSPLKVDGYTLYLMHMETTTDGGRIVQLLARKNPGSALALGGMVLILFGLFGFFVKRGKGEQA